MYWQIRGGKYSFVYFDSAQKKNVRLPQKQTPQIRTDKEADEFVKRWEAENDAKRARILKRLEWEKKYHDFHELLEIFGEAKRLEGHISWKDQVNAVKYHVFPYFLSIRQENNIHLWPEYFEEFRMFLKNGEPHEGAPIRLMAYASMNNIINALNSFLKILTQRKLTNVTTKCRHFPGHLCNQRDETSVISPENQKLIYSRLRERRAESADLFRICLNTGLRINEALGLSLADVFSEAADTNVVAEKLKSLGCKCFGFIIIDSQPVHRGKDKFQHHIERKPLKGKKKISADQCRIIPITDLATYNTLVTLWNYQRERYSERLHGENLKDYLLFPRMTYNAYASDLRAVQSGEKKIHSAHDTRHTYATHLAEKSYGDYVLCKMVLGHSDLEMTMRYVHIASKMKRTIESKRQLHLPMPYLKEEESMAG